jgi:hypothetical protein
MNTPEALDELLSQLLRRGLPADYARRAVEELADHHQDLVDELRAAGQGESQAVAEANRRLGEPRTLVMKTVGEYQRRYWCGRWRLTAFLFAPIPLLFLVWVATVVLYAALVVWPIDMLGLWGPETPPDGIVSTSEWVVASTIQGWFLFLVPAVLMLGLARLARRAAMGWRWVAVSACVLAFSACVAKCGFPAPELNHRYLDGTPLQADSFVFTVTFVAPGLSEVWWAWYRDQFGRILLPFAIATVVLFRSRQLARRSEQLALDGC